MSPRSDEMMAMARRRLATARGVLGEDPAAALGLAYYAMLYAARAALSEQNLYAKSHQGTWDRFWTEIVVGRGFDAELAASARERQQLRERVDYEAWFAPPSEAAEAIDVAERFIEAVAAGFP